MSEPTNEQLRAVWDACASRIANYEGDIPSPGTEDRALYDAMQPPSPLPSDKEMRALYSLAYDGGAAGHQSHIAGLLAVSAHVMRLVRGRFGHGHNCDDHDCPYCDVTKWINEMEAR